jgi:hypothetical protein
VTMSDPVAPFTPESIRASLVSIIGDAHRASVGTSTRKSLQRGSEHHVDRGVVTVEQRGNRHKSRRRLGRWRSGPPSGLRVYLDCHRLGAPSFFTR